MSASLAVSPDNKPPPALERMAERFVSDIKRELQDDTLVWPSIPAVVIRIRRIMNDPDSSVGDVAGAIAMDPALATRVLRFANTAVFGSVRTCKDLRDAVVRLGSTAVEHAVMLFVVGQVFNVGKRRQIQPHLARLWRHSTTVAAICEQLCKAQTHLKPEVAMLAGLIHDIGVLPILVRAEKVPKLLARAEFLDPLVQTLHTSVGQRMLDAWSLPEELVCAASEHENLQRACAEPLDYTDLVIAANVLSHAGQSHPLGGIDRETLPVFQHLQLDEAGLTQLLADAQATERTLRQ